MLEGYNYSCLVVTRKPLYTFVKILWSAAIVPFLRKRIVLGIIFSLSLTYCVLSFVREANISESNEADDIPARRFDKTFLWHSSKDDNNGSDVNTSNCRNSVQGRILIVDERGYLCLRTDVLPSGCCNTESENTTRYFCESCRESGCCSIYEHCISCCLHPDKKAVLQNMLGSASHAFNILFASVADHFELCLAKCRTSSLSEQHENTYRDPRATSCYGETPS